MRRKKRILVFILRAVMLFFGLLAVSAVIAISQIDLESLRDDVTRTLSAATGLPVEIDGAVSWKLSLRPRVSLQEVRIANAEWAKNPDFARIEQITATINLISLFTDAPAVEEMRMTRPHIFFEQNAKGESSVQITERTDVGQIHHDDNTFPFDLDIGLASLELIEPKVAMINPDGRTDWEFDFIKVKYKQTRNSLEYSGVIEKQGNEFSYLIVFLPLEESRKIYPLRIAIASRISPLVINAALEQKSKIPIDFIISGEISDLVTIGQLFNMDLPKTPALKLNISGGFDHGKLKIHKSSITSRRSDFAISGEYNWSSRRPHATIKLKSKTINMREMFPWIYAPDVPWVHPGRPLNVFKDTPLPVELLTIADADIHLDIDNLIMYREFNTMNVKSHMNIKDGSFTLEHSSKIADGDFRVAARGAEYNGEVRIRAAARGENVNIGKLLVQLRQNNVIYGLPSNVKLYVESRATNLSELMANMTGPVQAFSVGSGQALPDITEYLYGRDFLTALRHNVTDMVTGKGKYEKMKINCVAANLKLRDGMVETERGVAAETAEINLRMHGYVDLGRERLRAAMVATPVRGLKISATNNIVNSMEFNGDLAEPELKVSGRTIVNRAVTATGIGLLLAPFTGGLSIAAGAGLGFLTSDLLSNWLADDHPCRTAMNSGAPSKPGDPEWMNRPIDELLQNMGI
ncbi:MAG: AsmA family protein [Alphaproteobacteria bacterium]|nr:AsmA family protein [Alphaproteobacteria bacterium]